MTVKNEKGLVADHNNRSQITNVSLSTGEIFLALCLLLSLLVEVMIAFYINYKINVVEEGLKADLESYKMKTDRTISGIKYKLYGSF